MPKKGYKPTQEHKRKLSVIALSKTSHTANKGRFVEGHIVSKEIREKISKSLKGKTPWNKNTKGIMKPNKTSFMKGLSSWNKDRKLSEDHRDNLSKSHKGQIAWNKGLTNIYNEETKRKIGDASKKRIGVESHFWKGGISFEPYTIDWTETLRQSIRERDKYICRICGMPQSDKAYHVHHIDYCKTNNNTDNLITLCHNCHSKTNSNRDYWINYFKEIIDATIK